VRNSSPRRRQWLDFTWIRPPTPKVLNQLGERIKYGFFINDGLASILSIMADGKSVEVGLAGSEGFVGLPLAFGFETSPTRVILQVAGSGFKISAKDLLFELRECPKLATQLHRFSQELTLQASQIAACNRLHEVDERLARWLLMPQDRLGGDDVPLTQAFLAHMLGTRRASVTVAAGILQRAGLITYSPGQVKIESRSGLKEAACECYGTMVKQVKKWQAETSYSLLAGSPSEIRVDLPRMRRFPSEIGLSVFYPPPIIRVIGI
jgi:CRP-like cAMP-binding protein